MLALVEVGRDRPVAVELDVPPGGVVEDGLLLGREVGGGAERVQRRSAEVHVGSAGGVEKRLAEARPVDRARGAAFTVDLACEPPRAHHVRRSEERGGHLREPLYLHRRLRLRRGRATFWEARPPTLFGMSVMIGEADRTGLAPSESPSVRSRWVRYVLLGFGAFVLLWFLVAAFLLVQAKRDIDAGIARLEEARDQLSPGDLVRGEGRAADR